MYQKYLYESAILGTPRDVPKGYSRVEDVAVLHGPNFSKHCLCASCVMRKSPDFLRDACDPHPANSEKRDTYALQKILEMSSTWEYGKMRITKEARAAREDKNVGLCNRGWSIWQVLMNVIIFKLHF